MLPVVVIVGPTAVGKTNLSLQLAHLLVAEIVSADSRQIYRFLDIGTAKPTLPEREGVVHHFIDFLMPDVHYTAGEFAGNARTRIRTLREKNKNVIVVGGSGFYLRALLDGIIDIDADTFEIREKFKQQLEQDGLKVLYQRLKEVDPDLAARLSENDTQRILRGLEVFFSTGMTLSVLQKQKPVSADFPFVLIGLYLEREELYRRIDNRVDKMLKTGLLEEVKMLVRKGYTALNALNTIGYKEPVSYLRNEITYEKMIDLIKRNSRRYAKRQLTWFRRDKRVTWFNAGKENCFEDVQHYLEKLK